MGMVVNPQVYNQALPTVNYLGSNATSAGSLFTHTWSAVSYVEPPSATRVIVVGIAMRRGGGTSNISSVTIGGIAATVINSGAIRSNFRCALAYAVVPTGTSGNIVVTYNGTLGTGRSGLSAWSFSGMTTTPAQSAVMISANPVTVNVINTKPGIFIAFSYADTQSTDPLNPPAAPHDFTSAHTVNTLAGTHYAVGDANVVSAGTQTATSTSSNTAKGVVAAVWQIP